MLKLAGIFCICLIAFPAFSQSASKWQEGTITEGNVEGEHAEANLYDLYLRKQTLQSRPTLPVCRSKCVLVSTSVFSLPEIGRTSAVWSRKSQVLATRLLYE
jgi:hypothetical protein